MYARPAFTAPAVLAAAAVVLLLTFALALRDASSVSAAPEPPAKTVSNVRGTPEPPPALKAVRAYPNIIVKNPVVIARAPGSKKVFGENRLFVGDQNGKFFSFVDADTAKQADLFLDLSAAPLRPDVVAVPAAFEATYGLVFPPDFETNRVCYVCYVLRGKPKADQIADGSRVSRFKVEGNPPRAVHESEEVIITWMGGGHNGGDLHFGPDGCLYISTGDGSFPNPPDALLAGQDVTNLLSDILRIDVRQPQGDRKYTIPADNPFVNLEGARGEIWSYGFRNPWRMSFDSVTGDLWVGDVGWESYEMVYRIEKGGNYGWSIMEGPQPVRMEAKPGPTPILPPTIAIPHSEGPSVTGGYVYRGKKFPELVGQYVFGDWETRRIWAAKWDGEKVTSRVDITEPTVRVSAFGLDYDDELLLFDYDEGTLHRLERNPDSGSPSKFPQTLSETGLFLSVKDHTLSQDVVPFDINVPLWANHATAERFLYVPPGESIAWNDQPKAIAGSMFSRTFEWPKDSVLLKTLSLEMESGNPQSRRRLETQLLHYTGKTWRTYTYAWNDEQTDAALVPDAGDERTLNVADAKSPGGTRSQVWSFAGRAVCQRCHNPWAEHTLAFNVPQLNRPGTDGHNQIARLLDKRLLSRVAPEGVGTVAPPVDYTKLPKYVSPFQTAADLDTRARSYLHVNCAHCHRSGGGGTADIDLTLSQPLEKTKLLAARPMQGTFGIHDAEILCGGDPYRSVLFYRVSKIGRGRMPHVASELVDPQGVELIHDWIRQLPIHNDTRALIRRLAELAEPAPDPQQGDQRRAERTEALARLLESPTSAMLLSRAIEANELPAAVAAEAIAAGAAHADLAMRDLFERFLPAEKRSKRLGSVIRPKQILGMAGDVQSGRNLFLSNSAVACKNCHKVGDQGSPLGPELTVIGKKLNRSQLLESILEPSKSIEPKYVPHLVETVQGRVHTGLLVRRDAAEVVLRDAQDKEIRIPAGDVEQVQPQRQSLMPDLLARDLTAQQLADLLAFLESLK